LRTSLDRSTRRRIVPALAFILDIVFIGLIGDGDPRVFDDDSDLSNGAEEANAM
jgi:hypothetical protein